MTINFYKAFILIALGLFAFPAFSLPGDESNDNFKVDIQKAWFKPNLTVNSDPICNSLLSVTQTKFLSVDSQYNDLVGFKKIPGPFNNHEELEPNIQIDTDDPRQFIYRPPQGKKIFLYFKNLGGCGGACETEELHVSNKRFSDDSTDKDGVSTPASFAWNLLKDRKGTLYVQGIVDGKLQLYRIVSPKKWRLSCAVVLQPHKLQESDDPKVQTAIKAINELIIKTNGLSRGAGDCGSMGTAWRWKNNIQDGLYQTLYRPWALSVPDSDHYSENSWGDYDRIEKNLMLWSLGGIVEYRDFKSYNAQLKQTITTLANFYAKQFGWHKDRASNLARKAIRNTISKGFGFYMYDPFPTQSEADMRAAILGHSPMSEIRAIKFERAQLSTNDSILDIAVEYPEALSYLLKHGLNPNDINAFGKTPLMYASQDNQFEAVKLLLSSGANPDVATVHPMDTCAYTIQTVHMTALHYAVRYASKDVITLLLHSGAPTFAEDSNGQLPLDYVTKYENKNLTTADRDDLKTLLLPPDDKLKKILSKRENLKGEKLYTDKKLPEAYVALKRALMLDPENESALSNLTLIALKLDHFGESAAAASQLISTTKSIDLKANAFFNLGLACLKTEYGTINFDGHTYCDVGSYISNTKRSDNEAFSSFLSSYMLKPTKDRLNAVLDMFLHPTVLNDGSNCLFDDTQTSIHAAHFNGVNWYFLTDANKSLPFSKISATFSNGVQTFTPKSRETIRLNENLKIERWQMDEPRSVPTFMGNMVCAPALLQAFGTNTKVVAVYPTYNGDAASAKLLSSDGKFRKVSIHLTNTAPVILLLYGSYTEFILDGNLANLHAIFTYGNSTVTLPKSSNIQIKSLEKTNVLAPKWEFPGAMNTKMLYWTGLPLFSIFDIGVGENITLSDKAINENRVVP